MFLITEETDKTAKTTKLKATCKTLRCSLEATFYEAELKLGTWIGGGDDWTEHFEDCFSLKMARTLLKNEMKNFMNLAESKL